VKNKKHKQKNPEQTCKPLPAQTVSLADIGLDPNKTYIAYEFWTDQMIGPIRESLSVPELEIKGLRSYALREATDRPMLVSTSRHLSQGAAEIELMEWESNALSGRSHVIAEDTYTLVLHIPAGYTLEQASFDGQKAKVSIDGTTARVSFTSEHTQSTPWIITFTK